MARHKNADWNLSEGSPDTGALPLDQIVVAVLMDVRDELKQLNRLLGCENFLQIPAILRMIRANTQKPKRKRKKSGPPKLR